MKEDIAALVERLETFRPTYGWPEEQAVVAGPTLGEEAASTIRALVAENERATIYLHNLVCHFCREHFPENTEWRPLPDLLGMLTQMDNASTIARDYKAKLREAVGIIESLVEFTGAHGGPYSEARTFLATTEKPDG